MLDCQHHADGALVSGAPYPLTYYLSQIPSPNNLQPDFMATVALEVQPFVDLQVTLASMLGIFTPNSVGDQLDKVGVWVGASRDLTSPINGITTLADPDFQTLIKLVIAENNWDGTVPGAYNVWNSVFGGGSFGAGQFGSGGFGGGGTGIGLLITDYQDMTMAVLFTGTISAITAALITEFFNLRPAGVRIIGFFQPSVANAPVFGLDIENATIAGLDVGAWAVPLV
jgi:hypothetical protein